MPKGRFALDAALAREAKSLVALAFRSFQIGVIRSCQTLTPASAEQPRSIKISCPFLSFHLLKGCRGIWDRTQRPRNHDCIHAQVGKRDPIFGGLWKERDLR
jgi:hypothetical protein